jgi:hypothetical protein
MFEMIKNNKGCGLHDALASSVWFFLLIRRNQSGGVSPWYWKLACQQAFLKHTIPTCNSVTTRKYSSKYSSNTNVAWVNKSEKMFPSVGGPWEHGDLNG